MAISEAVLSTVCTVFYCSNTGILGSDPTWRMHEMCSMFVFFLSRQRPCETINSTAHPKIRIIKPQKQEAGGQIGQYCHRYR